jgi:hypothetical protein
MTPTTPINIDTTPSTDEPNISTKIHDIVYKFNRYNKGKGGFDELEMIDAIEALILEERKEAYKKGYIDGAIGATSL